MFRFFQLNSTLRLPNTLSFVSFTQHNTQYDKLHWVTHNALPHVYTPLYALLYSDDRYGIRETNFALPRFVSLSPSSKWLQIHKNICLFGLTRLPHTAIYILSMLQIAKRKERKKKRYYFRYEIFEVAPRLLLIYDQIYITS